MKKNLVVLVLGILAILMVMPVSSDAAWWKDASDAYTNAANPAAAESAVLALAENDVQEGYAHFILATRFRSDGNLVLYAQHAETALENDDWNGNTSAYVLAKVYGEDLLKNGNTAKAIKVMTGQMTAQRIRKVYDSVEALYDAIPFAQMQEVTVRSFLRKLLLLIEPTTENADFIGRVKDTISLATQ
jgi:hypothetical protein